MTDVYALLSGASTVGERIQRLIKAQGITPSDLHRRSGVAKGYLSELLTGDGSKMKPSAETLYAIGGALGVSVADLLGKTLPPRDDEAAWPPGLTEYVQEERVPPDEARMLAGIRTRGGPPTTVEGWRQIHWTILMHTERRRPPR